MTQIDQHIATTITTVPSVEIEPAALLGAIKAVARAMSTDDTRPHLHGLYVETDTPTTIAIVATDGHRIHLARVPAAPSGAPVAALLPASAVKRIASLAKDATRVRGARVTLTTMGGAWVVSDGLATLHGPCTDETFPPYRKVIPVKRETGAACGLVELDPRYLADACDAARDMKCGGVQIRVGDADLDPVRIDAVNPDVGELTCVIMPRRL